MPAVYLDISGKLGDTKNFVPLQVVQGQATVVRVRPTANQIMFNLSGLIGTLTIKRTTADAQPLVSKAGTTVGERVEFTFTTADMLALAAGDYVYDVWIADMAGQQVSLVPPSTWTQIQSPKTSDTGVQPSLLPGSYTCLASVAVTQAVYLSAVDTVAVADASTSAKMPVLGFVSAKPTSTTCSVVQDGELAGFVGLVPGAIYYASPTTAGGVTADANTIPAGGVVQKLGRARNSTTLVLDVDLDFAVL